MTKVMDWIDAWLPTEVARRHHSFPLRMEQIRQDGRLIVRIEAPGIDPPKDIDIVIDSGTLTISGRRIESEETAERSEFSYGEFMRMITLPRGVVEESVTAFYRSGILEISMELDDAAATPRHVPVQRGDATP